MITLDDFEALKRKVEKLRKLYDQSTGAKKQLLRRLKEEFGVANLKEAVKLLEKLKEEEVAHSRRYSKAKIAFEEKWKKQLKELDFNAEVRKQSGRI